MNSSMMLNCLFAAVFAAAAVGVLSCLGVVVGSSSKCPVFEGDRAGLYGACEMWQDIRGMLSFALGAGLCMLTQGSQSGDQVSEEPVSVYSEVEEESSKVQLSACLL